MAQSSEAPKDHTALRADDTDTALRAYWTQQFDEAYDFMFGRILPYPVQESGQACVSLPEAAIAAGVEVEFSSAPHVNDLPRLFYLREGQIEGFLGAAREMNQRGWVLRVEDAFRTREMQKYLGRTPAVFDAVLRTVVWELGGRSPEPAFMFKRCSGLVATVPKFGTHMSASAIDISVVYLDDRQREVDRGAPYLEMSALTPMDSPFVSAQAQNNRREISALMARHGFVGYPYEFWHYSSGDAYDQFLRRTGRPAIFGPIDLDLQSLAVRPFDEPTRALNTHDEVRGEIEAARLRAGQS